MKINYIILIAILVTFNVSIGYSGEDWNEDAVIGSVQGKQIQLEEIQNKKIHDLRVELYQNILHQFKIEALQKLAEKDKSIRLPNAHSIQVGDAEAKQFYDSNNLSRQGSYEQMADKIKEFMVSQKLQYQLEQLFANAVAKGTIKHNLRKPSDFLVKVKLKDREFNGLKSKVFVLEYSDFQCPYCKRIQPAIASMKEKYEGRVSFIFRHFPLSFHTEADEASLAVECAREQGKFDQYLKILFDNQKSIAEQKFTDYAKQVKIPNLMQFEGCLKKEKYRSEVESDMASGVEIGVTGTPAFIVGRFDANQKVLKGEIISGVLPQANFENIIQKYLD